MVMTSPGLDELTALLAKLRDREDAITSELERRRADVVGGIAAVEEAIRLLAAEREASQQTTVPDASLAVPPVLDSAAPPPETASDAQDAPIVAQDLGEDAVASPVAPEPPTAPASISAPPVRPRRVKGPNWQRELAGLQQGEAAVRIAQRIGGPVTVAQVAQILVEIGLTRATGKLAHGQANRVLATSRRFERVARGTYRLRIVSGCDASPSGS
jgi:hypothetical protein